jgi:hypothetical protein
MTLTKALLGIIFVISSGTGIVDKQGHTANLIPFPPPAIYETWWKEIAECEQLPLPADHTVHWAIVAVRPFYLAADTLHLAMDAMVITTDSITNGYINYSGILDRGLVTHEMAHVLLFKKFGDKYVGQHPDEYYTRCGLVAAGQQKLK